MACCTPSSTWRKLEERLARLGPERLAAELLDLADGDRDIAKRLKLLVREGDPAALARELKRRISGLKRSSRFVAYGESFGLARQVGEIARAIEDKVLALDPATAFELEPISVGDPDFLAVFEMLRLELG